MSALRVAVLRADDHHHRYLEWLLRSRFDVAFVAVEPGGARIRRMLRNRHYRNYIYNRYHQIRRIVTGKNAYRHRYFRHGPSWPAEALTRQTVDSINAEEVAAGLAAVEPDITVVIGCSILRTNILTAMRGKVINVHGGFLPDYKGNHCIFFALYDDSPNKVGVTIHHLNAGIDTGPLIEVVQPPVHGRENAEHLYSRAEKLAMHRLMNIIEKLEGGAELPASPQPARGQTYRTRDRGPTHDLRMAARRLRRTSTVLLWQAQRLP
jgi:methionyl-tRNA formyltransferase